MAASSRRPRAGLWPMVLGLALLLGGEARAHDFWIEPSTFHPGLGATVAVGLRVGETFPGAPVPRLSRAIDRFFVRQAGGDTPVAGADHGDPAGFLRAEGGATAVIGYSGGGSYLELPADRFTAYLRQYGLEAVIAERARRGETTKPGRERFYRHAKALLTGERGSPAVTRPLALDYEIVPDEDPTRGFAAFRGHVLLDGDPVADAPVAAVLRDDPSVRLSGRSDPDGAFSFALPRGGIWLITSIHMARAGFFSDADWTSRWASLIFALPDRQP